MGNASACITNLYGNVGETAFGNSKWAIRGVVGTLDLGVFVSVNIRIVRITSIKLFLCIFQSV